MAMTGSFCGALILEAPGWTFFSYAFVKANWSFLQLTVGLRRGERRGVSAIVAASTGTLDFFSE